jgi:peptidoglycan hydrolase CwlO-like protein
MEGKMNRVLDETIKSLRARILESQGQIRAAESRIEELKKDMMDCHNLIAKLESARLYSSLL